MRMQAGNLSLAERAGSAAIALVVGALARRGASPLTRLVAGTIGAGLVARAIAGHCGVKAAYQGHSSLSSGMWDQAKCLFGIGRAREPLPGSPAHRYRSHAVDQAVDDSFPASDPPASRLPDEPPSNAQAKWEAAAVRRRYS
jgi:hypothetical protein